MLAPGLFCAILILLNIGIAVMKGLIHSTAEPSLTDMGVVLAAWLLQKFKPPGYVDRCLARRAMLAFKAVIRSLQAEAPCVHSRRDGLGVAKALTKKQDNRGGDSSQAALKGLKIMLLRIATVARLGSGTSSNTQFSTPGYMDPCRELCQMKRYLQRLENPPQKTEPIHLS